MHKNCRPHGRSSPPLAVSRKRDRAWDWYTHKLHRERLHKAQSGVCAICTQPMHGPIHQSTIDHVIPISLGGGDNMGNLLAVHGPCNSLKGSDIPTGCEMIWLLWINAKIGAHPVVF